MALAYKRNNTAKKALPITGPASLHGPYLIFWRKAWMGVPMVHFSKLRSVLEEIEKESRDCHWQLALSGCPAGSRAYPPHVLVGSAAPTEPFPFAPITNQNPIIRSSPKQSIDTSPR